MIDDGVSAAQGHRQHLLRRHQEPRRLSHRHPAGNILVNSTYDATCRSFQKSIEQLGFKLSDTKFCSSHAHGDHQEADAA